jgi:transketolase
MMNINFPAKSYASGRDGFGKALVELGEKDSNVWVLTADVSESTRTHWFAEKYPSRFVQVGVSEQNLVGVASGIAACGKKAFVSAYGVFSPGRNLDQIRISVCYNDVPVIFHGSHTGITVGPDGASHQALEDIAIMRTLPNMTVMAPADAEETRKATIAAYELGKPAYIRTFREKMAVFTTPETPFKVGHANVYREGMDVAVFACGPMVYEALMAAEELQKEGVSCAVVDCHTIKPMDRKSVVEWAKKTGLIVTVEEHQVSGGMGSAVTEVVTEEYLVPVKRHGIYDQFCESGTALELMRKYKLDAAGIASVVKDSMVMKRK